MRLQLLSDLHLETEHYEPQPAAGAELLVIAGDIDSTWSALERFRGWPVPMLFVAGNHEFDGREWNDAWPALRERCDAFGMRMLERESVVLTDARGQRVRFVGTARWSDFDLYGPDKRERCMRAASYFMALMDAKRGGLPFDAQAVREEALACRDWLAAELARPNPRHGSGASGHGDSGAGWDRTVAITHFAPSFRSADPRYGAQPGTASFCNADDDLLPLADLWLHGHLHCQHDYRVERSDGSHTRVVCNSRGHERKGEARGHDPHLVIEA